MMGKGAANINNDNNISYCHNDIVFMDKLKQL